jgi:two-component system, NarL family, sensor histidine kinase LiaS
MTNRFSALRRLRWKLTLSYTLVTVSVVLLLEIALLGLLFFYLRSSPTIPRLTEQQTEQVAIQIQPFLAYESPENDSLSTWLESAFPSRPRGSAIVDYEFGSEQDEKWRVVTYDGDFVVVVALDGTVIASNIDSLAEGLSPGHSFSDPVAPEESEAVFQRAVSGETTSRSLPDSTLVAAAPIVDQDGRTLGAVYTRVSSLAPGMDASFLLEMLRLLGASAVFFIIGAGAIGTLFGFITARGLSRRISAISLASDAWSRGDFSEFIKDASGDELGELSQRLNRMAEQLQNLLQTHEELAGLEERNRLARDLHDSVKQQVFATAMQVGAARTVLESDPGTAASRLDEAERLAQQAQRELTALIRELRPAALEGKGLAAALRELLGQWSRQSGIQSSLSTSGEQALSLPAEQALYRVAQEALSNAARHSQASRAKVHLAWENGLVTLTVTDNGQGFDLDSVSKKGIGLQSMRERVAALGGAFSVEKAGSGIRVVATIPTEGRLPKTN